MDYASSILTLKAMVAAKIVVNDKARAKVTTAEVAEPSKQLLR